jgi:hypothetical protein
MQIKQKYICINIHYNLIFKQKNIKKFKTHLLILYFTLQI